MNNQNWNARDMKALVGAFTAAPEVGKTRVLFAGHAEKHETLSLLGGLRKLLGAEIEAHCIIDGKSPHADESFPEIAAASKCYIGTMKSAKVPPKSFDLVFIGVGSNVGEAVNHFADALAPQGVLAFLQCRNEFGEAAKQALREKFTAMAAYIIRVPKQHYAPHEEHVCAFYARLPAINRQEPPGINNSVLQGITSCRAGSIVLPTRRESEITLRMDTIGLAAFSHLVAALPDCGAHWNFTASQAVASEKPLSPLSPWHALMAAGSGMYQGVVRSRDGRRMLLKGRIAKRQEERRRTVEMQRQRGGTAVMTEIDRMFIPAVEIVLLDITPGKNMGEVRHVF